MLDKSLLLQVFEDSSYMYQAPSRPHGLLHGEFREWVERHPSERLQELARGIYEQTRYVSHAEFFSVYDRIAEELLYKAENSDRTVYLYLGLAQIRKSNFWILLYLLSRMYRVVDAVITAEDLPGIDLNSVIIIPDDAIYSGRQMATQLSRLYRVVPEEVPVVIASGFISVTGRELLSSMGERVRFPVQSESFDVVRLPRDVYVHHQRASDLHTIYFDHKLADMYSIYQTIYAFGVGLSDESDVFPFRPVSLIDNCDPVSIVYEAYGEGYSVEETVEYFLEDVFTGVDIQDSIEICPFSPYKKLKYSLRGRVIEAIEEFVV